MNAITLSMPRTAPGVARIRARGDNLDVIVGDCVRSGNQWRAALWSRAGQHTPGDNFIYGGSLKELRIKLEEQIARQGPWWTQPPAEDQAGGEDPGVPRPADRSFEDADDYVILITFD